MNLYTLWSGHATGRSWPVGSPDDVRAARCHLRVEASRDHEPVCGTRLCAADAHGPAEPAGHRKRRQVQPSKTRPVRREARASTGHDGHMDGDAAEGREQWTDLRGYSLQRRVPKEI